MTTLILDWSDWDGAASGWVSLTRVTWRRDPDTYQVPWTRQVRVEGRAVVDVQGMAGEVLRVRWAPDGGGSRTDHVLVPDEGEHLAHLLERVDESTLEPLPEADALTAADLLARVQAEVDRLAGTTGGGAGEDGADGRGIQSITAEGATATVTYTDGGVDTFTLPAGPEGDPGSDGADGADGHTPVLTWQGTALAVDGVPGPDLRGPAGKDGEDGADGQDGARGPANSLSIGTVTTLEAGAQATASITGAAPAQTLSLGIPRGADGTGGGGGGGASPYVIVGPGRPDQPSTTAGTITGAEPVGAEYRSQDGAQVGADVWLKTSRGWIVSVGDTGWRNVKAGALTSPSQLSIRRVGALVMVSGEHQSAPSTESAVYVPPSGFLASKGPSRFVSGVSGNGGRAIIGDGDGSIRVAGGGTWARFSITTFTADPWPTSLPGSPA